MKTSKNSMATASKGMKMPKTAIAKPSMPKAKMKKKY